MTIPYIEIRSNKASIIETKLNYLMDNFTTPITIEFNDASLIYIRNKRDLGYLLAGLKIKRE